MYHWGVTVSVVWRWRKVLGIARNGTEGSRRLIQAAAEKGAGKVRGKDRGPEWAERCRERSKRLNSARHLKAGYHGPWWTPEERALLGTLPDKEIAQRIGKSRDAVRRKRYKMGIPPCP
jgi:hypothetical protein